MKAATVFATLALLLPASAAAQDEDSVAGAATEKLKELLAEEPEVLSAPWEEPREDEEACTPEEIAVLRELRARSRKLDAREADLVARQRAIEELEAHAAEQLARLEAMRGELLAVISQEEARQNDKVAQLAKVVGQMKAKAAAPMLAGMDERTALAVLEQVPAKQAGKILAAMPPDVAQRLGDSYTKLEDPRRDEGEAAPEAGGDS